MYLSLVMNSSAMAIAYLTTTRLVKFFSLLFGERCYGNLKRYNLEGRLKKSCIQFILVFGRDGMFLDSVTEHTCLPFSMLGRIYFLIMFSHLMIAIFPL